MTSTEARPARPANEPRDSGPFYLPLGDEVQLFEAAYAERMPVLLKGPTGCGKTRFLEAMAWRLDRRRSGTGGTVDLTTIACHEDLTASDLVGRYLLSPEGTAWVDGPLTTAVRSGGICYLDEVVEARKDTIVVIHALTDHRRMLPITKLGSTVPAHADFLLVVSYNPGYQSTLKDLKPSTRQRFVAIDFGYPSEEAEAQIVAAESGLEAETSAQLAALAARLRILASDSRMEGPSTRLLIYAAGLIRQGIDPHRACEQAICRTVTDDPALQEAITEVTTAVLG
jgi:nitric oxide reductase NorQ protein